MYLVNFPLGRGGQGPELSPLRSATADDHVLTFLHIYFFLHENATPTTNDEHIRSLIYIGIFCHRDNFIAMHDFVYETVQAFSSFCKDEYYKPLLVLSD